MKAINLIVPALLAFGATSAHAEFKIKKEGSNYYITKQFGSKSYKFAKVDASFAQEAEWNPELLQEVALPKPTLFDGETPVPAPSAEEAAAPAPVAESNEATPAPAAEGEATPAPAVEAPVAPKTTPSGIAAVDTLCSKTFSAAGLAYDVSEGDVIEPEVGQLTAEGVEKHRKKQVGDFKTINLTPALQQVCLNVISKEVAKRLEALNALGIEFILPVSETASLIADKNWPTHYDDFFDFNGDGVADATDATYTIFSVAAQLSSINRVNYLPTAESELYVVNSTIAELTAIPPEQLTSAQMTTLSGAINLLPVKEARVAKFTARAAAFNAALGLLNLATAVTEVERMARVWTELELLDWVPAPKPAETPAPVPAS